MVNIYRTLFFILLYLPLLAYSKPSLEIEVKNPVVEYGRPVYLTLIAAGIKRDLSDLRFDKLSSLFSIEFRDIESETLNTKNEKGNKEITQQKLRLKLYPRQTGKVLIPAFTLEDAASNEIELTILDASNNDKPIVLSSTSSSTQVWQREQILITLTLNTADEFATIKLGDQAVAGVEITPLPVSRVWDKNKNGGQSIIKTGWSLLPLQPGYSEIELPAVEYYLNGVVRRVFHLPKLKLDIQPLPSYLPPTIPVGKISISSSITVKNSDYTGFLYTDDLAYWKVSIESKSLTPYWLPPVLRQIKSADNITFFPATSTRSLQPDKNGVNGRVSHSIPFKPLANGNAEIPDLKIQYFDTATGRLETLVHQTRKPFSIGIISRVIVVIFISVFFLILAQWLSFHIAEKIQTRKRRQQAVLKISQANTTAEILTGLRMVSEAEGWPANLSLSGWLQRWKKRYHSKAELDKVIQTLSLMHYDSKNKNTLQKELKSITAQLEKIIVAAY